MPLIKELIESMSGDLGRQYRVAVVVNNVRIRLSGSGTRKYSCTIYNFVLCYSSTQDAGSGFFGAIARSWLSESSRPFRLPDLNQAPPGHRRSRGS